MTAKQIVENWINKKGYVVAMSGKIMTIDEINANDIVEMMEEYKAQSSSAMKWVRANDVAFDIGDTFIEFDRMSPKDQWEKIFKMLNENGYAVIESEQSPINGVEEPQSLK